MHVQVAQAKNVDLLNQMHQLRLENEKTQAALTDSHALETRAAFVTVRQVLGSPLPAGPPPVVASESDEGGLVGRRPGRRQETLSPTVAHVRSQCDGGDKREGSACDDAN